MAELLVTGGILLTLAAIVVPSVGVVRREGDDVKCLSNLRQIGMGVVAYANDHEGWLPGPLYTAQYPYLNDNTQLALYLESYLELDATITKVRRPDVFLCPAFKRVIRQMGESVGDSPVYLLNVHVNMNGAPALPPFGYPNKRYPQTFGAAADYPPMRLAQLAALTDEANRSASTTTWMLKDIDQLEYPNGSKNQAGVKMLPATMVHGNHRNVVFFDFHAEHADFAGQ